ncbi:MAG: N-acetyltransferase family protein [Pseudomonadota bacterium]
MQIRRAVPSDAPFIADTYRPFVDDSWASFEQTAPDAEEIVRRIEAAGDLYPWLIAERDHSLAYAYASPHRVREAYVSSVDTTIYCADGARGKGVGTALYKALINILAQQGYVMAFAGIALPNDASVRLHEAVGFECIGTYPSVGYKHGAWRDTQWWGRPLAQPCDPPAPILPVSAVIGMI